MKKIFIPLILGIIVGCASMVLVKPSVPGEVLSKGWSKDYTKFLQANVTPLMLQFPAPSFCPKYSSLDMGQLRDFWAAVIEATAYAETGFNRLDMYREDGIGDPDSVTGKNNVSEGLLQLSYGDAACKGVFDYPSDKAAFLDDYAHLPQAVNQGEMSSKHPERTILDPYKNLQCGINIWTALIRQYGNQPALTTIGGKYWSTLRPGRSVFGEDTLPYFKKRFPSCF